ncbi:hypothetical protein HG530_001996 [Fusarium avenaceum]|nr:hypothetical protein HG530_001996 [Fusarium avenaceum]
MDGGTDHLGGGSCAIDLCRRVKEVHREKLVASRSIFEMGKIADEHDVLVCYDIDINLVVQNPLQVSGHVAYGMRIRDEFMLERLRIEQDNAPLLVVEVGPAQL